MAEEEASCVKNVGAEDEKVLAAATVVLLAATVEREDTSNPSRRDFAFHGAEDASVARKVCDADAGVVLAGEPCDFIGLSESRDEWLLAEDADALSESRADYIEMVARQAGADIHDVKPFLFKEFLPTVIVALRRDVRVERGDTRDGGRL